MSLFIYLKVAAGKGPFIGFHHALEGVEGRSVLTDVAQAVKSKFKYVFQRMPNSYCQGFKVKN